jgi:hypothetical protein
MQLTAPASSAEIHGTSLLKQISESIRALCDPMLALARRCFGLKLGKDVT